MSSQLTMSLEDRVQPTQCNNQLNQATKRSEMETRQGANAHGRIVAKLHDSAILTSAYGRIRNNSNRIKLNLTCCTVQNFRDEKQTAKCNVGQDATTLHSVIRNHLKFR